jgi:parallel beta-helix repeat protein|tara:strand:+ start:361 stop:1932 length:1572 start_codon:yes stop_codon:yes gene_type:complete
MALTKATYRMSNSAPVSALDFGADNTGSADSSSAIQSAVNSLSGGGTVVLPTGTYLLSSGVVLGDNVNIAGTAGGSIINCASMSGGAFGAITVGANSIVQDIKFTGIAEDVAGASAIKVTGKDGAIIQNCIITGFGEGLLINNCDDVMVKNNKITGAGRWGIRYAKATNLIISNNVIKNSVTYDGIKGDSTIYGDATLYSSSNVLIDSNISSGNNRDGIDVSSQGDSITVSNNICDSNTLMGMEIKKLSTATSDIKLVNVFGNTCTNNGSHGIRFDDVLSSKASGNIVEGNGDIGIRLTYCKDCDVLDNIVKNNSADGIRLQGESGNICEYINVLGNKCINNGNGSGSAIQIEDYCDYVVVKQNSCYQNSASKTDNGIFVSGTTATTRFITIKDNYAPNSLTIAGQGIVISGTHSGDNIVIGNNDMSITGVVSFSNADATPNIYGCNKLYQTDNSGSTTITAFDGGSYEMEAFTILFNDSNTTVNSSSSVRLKGGANKTFSQYSTLTLVKRNNVFYEIARQET